MWHTNLRWSLKLLMLRTLDDFRDMVLYHFFLPPLVHILHTATNSEGRCEVYLVISVISIVVLATFQQLSFFLTISVTLDRNQTTVTLLLQQVHMLTMQLDVASGRHVCQEFMLRLHFHLLTNILWLNWPYSSDLEAPPLLLTRSTGSTGILQRQSTDASVLVSTFHLRVKDIFRLLDRGNTAVESSNVTHTARLK